MNPSSTRSSGTYSKELDIVVSSVEQLSQDRLAMQKIEKVSMGKGKPLPPLVSYSDAYIVDFDGSDDPLNPQNWPLAKKYAPLNP